MATSVDDFYDSEQPPLDGDPSKPDQPAPLDVHGKPTPAQLRKIAILREHNLSLASEDQDREYARPTKDTWDLRVYRPRVRKNALLNLSGNVEEARNFLEIAVRNPIARESGRYSDAVSGLKQALMEEGLGKRESAAIVRGELDRLQKIYAAEQREPSKIQAGGDETGRRYGAGREGTGR